MLLQSLAKEYDYMLIDAPSGVGGIPASLLSISDSVLIIVNCRVLSLKTIPLFLKLVKDIKAHHNSRLDLEGVVITMYNEKSNVEKQILGEIKKAFPPQAFFQALVPFNEYFEEASMHSVPVALMPDGLKVARPYVEIAMELKEKEAKQKINRGGQGDEEIMGLF
jgi:chromosome partitioning protein